MAIQPNEPFATQDTLQPGARGESFIASLPGYRDDATRVNRTNTHLNCCDHDVPNCKWEMDDRLPVLFKYGFAYGFNQIIVPKGRIVALDPNMSMVDFETKKQHNVLTLANGGVPVRVRETGDVYNVAADFDAKSKSTDITSNNTTSSAAVAGVGKDWAPLTGLNTTYTKKYFRPFAGDADATTGVCAFVSPSATLTDKGYSFDSTSGRVVDSSNNKVTVRPANVPVGVIERNEYTRDIDAYNGFMPGPIRTDAMIELPWFLYKDLAEKSPWGSAYGDIRPGSLMKSDENGRFVVSPLSDLDIVATMSQAEYEAERRQVIGEVYSATQELVPEGAAKWAVWALEDRLNFDEFNPATWKETNRKGEDAVSNSPYASTGEYPGYPFDKAFNNSNLHMLGAVGRDGNYDLRLEQEYQYSNLGIPGLTDGYNAVLGPEKTAVVGSIHYRGDDATVSYIDQIFAAPEVYVEGSTFQVKLGDGTFVNAVVGQELADGFTIVYADAKQGLIKVQMDDDKADTALKAATDTKLDVTVKYQKRGLAGVPTFLDWDGVIGSVKVLLTK